jgi:hypothetical protein
MPVRHFAFLLVVALATLPATARSENLGGLYDACSVSYVPEGQRTREDWINARRCEDFVYAAVIGMNWYSEAIRVRHEGRYKIVAQCPSRENIAVQQSYGENGALFSKTKLVEDFLAYWSAADAGRFTRLMLDAKAAVETAFKSRYPDCRSMDKAPPCKNGSQACDPWERDWSKTELKPVTTVTKEGNILEPTPAKPPAECATAKTAEECADTLKKLGKNPFDAFGSVGSEPVYGGQR